MAENNDTGGGWWNGWIQAAKEKSVSALDFVKKDLAEFTNTMQSDTTAVASDVKSKLTSEQALAATKKAKDGVSQLFGGITKVLTVEAEDKPLKSKPSLNNKPIFDRAQARRNTIQLDPGTYCDDPEGSQDEYEAWVSTFNLDGRKGDISELLVINVEVRALYTQLVPSKVSHADFWQRYFYKLYQLEKDEKRKADLMKRAEDVQEEIGWDEEDDWGDMDGPSSPPKQGGMHLAAKELSEAKTSGNDEDQCSVTSSETPSEDVVTDEEKHVKSEMVKLPDEVQSVNKNENKGNNDEIKDNNDEIKDNNGEIKDNNDVENKDDNKESDLRQDEKRTTLETDSKEIRTVENDTDKIDKKINDTSAIITEDEAKVEQVPSPTDDSSLSISSVTDSSLPGPPKQMESSSDTLTLVSPLEEISTAETGLSKDEGQSSDSVSKTAPVIDSISGEQIGCSNDEKEIKTKVKGDLVVVGSGASSERTTPSSTASSNRETEDDWEKEFEVTEDDLAQHTTTKLTVDTKENDDMEDDWESWD